MDNMRFTNAVRGATCLEAYDAKTGRVVGRVVGQCFGVLTQQASCFLPECVVASKHGDTDAWPRTGEVRHLV